jgi:hypothetical protein
VRRSGDVRLRPNPLGWTHPALHKTSQDFGLGRAGEQTRAFFQVFRNPPPLARSALTGFETVYLAYFLKLNSETPYIKKLQSVSPLVLLIFGLNVFLNGFSLRLIIALLIIFSAFLPLCFGAEERIKHTFPIWWGRRTTCLKVVPTPII